MSTLDSTILAIATSCEYASSLVSLLAPPGTPVQCVSTCRGALEYLARNATSLVLCESRLPDGDWRTVIDALLTMKNAPLLMVFPSRADETLVADALAQEEFQVQVKPFDPVEVKDVIRTVLIGSEVSCN